MVDLVNSGTPPQLARVPETNFALTVLCNLNYLTEHSSIPMSHRGFDDLNLTISSSRC